MKETQRHKDAFEQYYALGYKRSCPQVAQKLAVSTNSVKKWRLLFHWSERIMLRDREISENVAKKIIKEEEDIRLEAYNNVKALRSSLLQVLDTAYYEENEEGKKAIRDDIMITNAREFRDVVLGALKCEEAALSILAPEEKEKPSGVLIIEHVEISDKIAKKVLDEVAKEGLTEQDNGSTSAEN